MISDLDSYIVTRMRRIQFEGESIRVLLDYPERDAGKAIYPCIAVVRQEPEIAKKDMRPSANVWIPSELQTTTEFDGETYSGSDSFTVKPYPVPVVIRYDIMVYATSKSQINYLMEAIYKVLPPHTTTSLAGQNPFFLYSNTAMFGDLDLPLYGINFELEVRDIYIERVESQVIPSLKGITLDTHTAYFDEEIP